MIRLKFERIQRGLSQSGLAHLANLPQPVVCLIEKGTRNPAPDDLIALGRALGVSPDALLRPVEIAERFPGELGAVTR